MDILDIVEGCIKGDTKSQEALYIKFNRPLYTMCNKYNYNGEEVEDMLQDAFIIIFTNISKFNPDKYAKNKSVEETLFNWCVATIKNNQLLKYNESKDIKFKSTNFQEFDSFLHPSSEDEVYEEEEEETIGRTEVTKTDYDRAIDRLPDEHRDVYNRVVVDGAKRKIVAKELGITYACLGYRLKKAKIKVARYMSNVEFYNKMDAFYGND